MTEFPMIGDVVIAQLTRAVRQRHGLTQEQFAVALGVTKSTVLRIEQGANTHASVVRLVQMYDRHGVPDWTLTDLDFHP
jgi:transcriptional regulator with XRE-family HTH domain